MKGSEIKVSLSFVCPLLWTPQLWRDMVGSLPPKRCIIRARLILRHRSTHTWKHGVHFGWKAFVEEGKEKVAIWTGKEKYWSPRTWFWCKARFCASCTMEHRGTRECMSGMMVKYIPVDFIKIQFALVTTVERKKNCNAKGSHTRPKYHLRVITTG